MFKFFFFAIAVWMIAFSANAEANTQSAHSTNDIYYVAATLYGEAFGEGQRGMIAVLEVIENRAFTKTVSLQDVVLQHRHFSCWNEDAPALEVLQNLAEGRSSGNITIDTAFQEVLKLTTETLAFAERERLLSRDVLHYWAPAGMPGGEPPYWYSGEPIVQIGNHIFAAGVN